MYQYVLRITDADGVQIHWQVLESEDRITAESERWYILSPDSKVFTITIRPCTVVF